MRRRGASAPWGVVGLVCAVMAVAAPGLAREFTDSSGMKEMTVLDCTGKGRWARGPMDAHEIYAVDTANNDILLYDAQNPSFSSLCKDPSCSVGIDGGGYSVSRDDGEATYSLSISRATGGWAEDQATRSDRTAFVKKAGACKAIRNPLGKAPKTKF